MKITKSKAFAFVLMPFSQQFDDIYMFGIKGACDEVECYCERVDEQIFVESIMDRIYNQISKADIIIADMSSRNPNVFYEVGYAHALAKKVILLTQKSEDIPFDLMHFPHIIYNNKINYLKTELRKKLKWAIDYPNKPWAEVGANLKFYLSGVELIDNPEILYTEKSLPAKSISICFDINNDVKNNIETASVQIGLVSTKRMAHFKLPKNEKGRVVILPTGGLLHLYDRIYTILPGSWGRVVFNISSEDVFQNKELLTFFLRVFTEKGTKDYPFKLRIIDVSENKEI